MEPDDIRVIYVCRKSEKFWKNNLYFFCHIRYDKIKMEVIPCLILNRNIMTKEHKFW